MAFDLVKVSDEYAAQFTKFYLDPAGWRTFETPTALAWQKIRFTEENSSKVPTERGIYVFSVEHQPSQFPSHGYILYAGISGNTSGAHLRRRYNQYLRHQKTGEGRPRVIYMLQKWPSDLFFSYCPLPDGAIDLAKLETSLLGALSPPMNTRDFPAKISAARRARFG